MQINRSNVIGVSPRSEARAWTGEKPAVRSSMKPSHATNNNLIDRARQIWQPRVGRNLTHKDARQISENITGFFSILAEWSRGEVPTPANDTGKPVASDNEEVRDDR
jgi:hypothetical protein